LSEDVQKIHASFQTECKKIWSPSRVGVFFGHCCCASSLNIAVSGVTLRNDNLFDSVCTIVHTVVDIDGMIVINWLIKEVEGSYFGVRKDTICSMREDTKGGGKGVTIHVLNPASPRYEAKSWQSPHNSKFQKCCLLRSSYEMLHVN
jgi:hypothetical protein